MNFICSQGNEKPAFDVCCIDIMLITVVMQEWNYFDNKQVNSFPLQVCSVVIQRICSWAIFPQQGLQNAIAVACPQLPIRPCRARMFCPEAWAAI
uniref:Uncharacterized protein n=1 Tax=Oryza brachyantha TaxID=4533 RepID=J3LLE6_ORYBR